MAFARTSTLALASAAIVWASSCWSMSDLSFGGTTGNASKDDRDAICVPGFVTTMQIPTDFFVLQDKSESMLCSAAAPSCTSIVIGDTTPPTRWDAVVEAMGIFVNAAEGKGVGIGFFDQPTDAAESCNAADYAMPVVPIAPGNGQRISSAVAAIRPSGGNAILPALQGSAASPVRRSTQARLTRLVDRRPLVRELFRGLLDGDVGARVDPSTGAARPFARIA
jgi:hypothetical protein